MRASREAKAVARELPSDDVLTQLSDIFQIMSDPNRLRILYCISRNQVCVCDLSSILGLSVSAVSHQLRLLRASRLVKFRREGRMMYYSLANGQVTKLIKAGLRHEEK